jgi:hypothetical protein
MRHKCPIIIFDGIPYRPKILEVWGLKYIFLFLLNLINVKQKMRL